MSSRTRLNKHELWALHNLESSGIVALWTNCETRFFDVHILFSQRCLAGFNLSRFS